MNRLAPLRFVALLAVAPPSTLAAQGPPGTDVWVAPLSRAGRRLVLGTPVNLTQRPGYDNQPSFLPDGSGSLFTRIGADSQADVWRYDFAADVARPLITTPESEYSPTPIPGSSGISVVRVERDSTQRLWRFDADGDDPGPRARTAETRRLSRLVRKAAARAVRAGQPQRARARAAVGADRADTVARDIGRSLQSIPGRRAVSFVQHVDSTAAWLMELDAGSARYAGWSSLPRRRGVSTRGRPTGWC